MALASEEVVLPESGFVLSVREDGDLVVSGSQDVLVLERHSARELGKFLLRAWDSSWEDALAKTREETASLLGPAQVDSSQEVLPLSGLSVSARNDGDLVVSGSGVALVLEERSSRELGDRLIDYAVGQPVGGKSWWGAAT